MLWDPLKLTLEQEKQRADNPLPIPEPAKGRKKHMCLSKTQQKSFGKFVNRVDIERVKSTATLVERAFEVKKLRVFTRLELVPRRYKREGYIDTYGMQEDLASFLRDRALEAPAERCLILGILGTGGLLKNRFLSL